MRDHDQDLRVYDVRVELGGAGSGEDLPAGLRIELEADVAGWLSELDPRVATTAQGRTAVDLEVAGPDVWTSALTAMAVLRQLDFDLLALHVRSRT